jgi:hypothetical protein
VFKIISRVLAVSKLVFLTVSRQKQIKIRNFFLSAKKKKPKLLNKFDKTIKAELDAAEKLRKRVG